MKKTILSVLTLAAAVASVQAVEIKGKLKGFTNDTLVVRTIPASAYMTDQEDNAETSDTIVVKNHKFVFRKALKETTYLELNLAELKIPYKKMGISPNAGRAVLMVEPDEKVEVELTKVGGRVETVYKGKSVLNQGITREINALMPSFEKEAGLLRRWYVEKNISADEMNEQFGNVRREIDKSVVASIAANADQPVALFLLADFAPITEVDSLYQTLKVKAPALSSWVQRQVERSVQVKERERVRKANQGKDAEGEVAPDFTLNTPEGTPLSLSSLRGKYVILDFWGSWCIWCIKGMPQMRDFYKAHSDKVEILGVACNDRDAAWRAALKKYEMTWKQVFNPRDTPAAKNVVNLYNIEGFPTKYLINPEGKIVLKVVGEDPSFYDKVTKLVEEGK